MDHISTDLVIDAIRVTRDVYLSNASRLASGGNDRMKVIMAELKRVSIMEQLLADENLCEMLAGRLHQLSHGVPKS